MSTFSKNFLADVEEPVMLLPKISKRTKKDGKTIIEENPFTTSFKTGFGKKRYGDAFEKGTVEPEDMESKDLFEYLGLKKENQNDYYMNIKNDNFYGDIEGMKGSVVLSSDRSIVINSTVAALLNTKLITNYGVSMFQLVPLKPVVVYLYNKYINDQTVDSIKKKMEAMVDKKIKSGKGDQVKHMTPEFVKSASANKYLNRETKFFSKFFDFLRNYRFILQSLMDDPGYQYKTDMKLYTTTKKDKDGKVVQVERMRKIHKTQENKNGVKMTLKNELTNTDISKSLIKLLKNKLEESIVDAFENTKQEGKVLKFSPTMFKKKSNDYVDHLQMLFKKTYEEVDGLIREFEKQIDFDECYNGHQNASSEKIKIRFKTQNLISRKHRGACDSLKKDQQSSDAIKNQRKAIENQIKKIQSDSINEISQTKIESNKKKISKLRKDLREMTQKVESESKLSAFVKKVSKKLIQIYVDRGQTKLSEHYYSILDNMHFDIKDIMQVKIKTKKSSVYKNTFYRNVVSKVAKNLWGFSYKSTKNETQAEAKNSDYSSSVTINPIARELYRDQPDTIHRYVHLPGSYEALLNLNFGVLMVRPLDEKKLFGGIKEKNREIAFSGSMMRLFHKKKNNHLGKKWGYEAPTEYNKDGSSSTVQFKQDNKQYYIASLISAGIIPLMINVAITDLIFDSKNKDCSQYNSMHQIFEKTKNESMKNIDPSVQKEIDSKKVEIAKLKTKIEKEDDKTTIQKHRKNMREIQSEIKQLESQAYENKKYMKVEQDQMKTGRIAENVRFYLKNMLEHKKSIASATYEVINEHTQNPKITVSNKKSKNVEKYQCSYYSIRFFKDLYSFVRKESSKFKDGSMSQWDIIDETPENMKMAQPAKKTKKTKKTQKKPVKVVDAKPAKTTSSKKTKKAKKQSEPLKNLLDQEQDDEMIDSVGSDIMSEVQQMLSDASYDPNSTQKYLTKIQKRIEKSTDLEKTYKQTLKEVNKMIDQLEMDRKMAEDQEEYEEQNNSNSKSQEEEYEKDVREELEKKKQRGSKKQKGFKKSKADREAEDFIEKFNANLKKKKITPPKKSKADREAEDFIEKFNANLKKKKTSNLKELLPQEQDEPSSSDDEPFDVMAKPSSFLKESIADIERSGSSSKNKRSSNKRSSKSKASLAELKLSDSYLDDFLNLTGNNSYEEPVYTNAPTDYSTDDSTSSSSDDGSVSQLSLQQRNQMNQEIEEMANRAYKRENDKLKFLNKSTQLINDLTKSDQQINEYYNAQMEKLNQKISARQSNVTNAKQSNSKMTTRSMARISNNPRRSQRIASNQKLSNSLSKQMSNSRLRK